MADLPLPPTDLRTADVLLYHGEGFVSSAIRLFDGTEVSHAGVCFAPDFQVIEALGGGVEQRPLATSVGGAAYVLAYRHKSAPTSTGLVEAVARSYLGEPYAYEQIVLLALLCTTRRAKATLGLGLLVRRAADAAAARLLGWFREGRKAMICSELVYRSFDEALPDPSDVYSIELRTPPVFGPPAHGAEPGSILDFLLGPAGRATGVGAVAFGPPAAPPAVGDDEVESAAQAYLDEIRRAAPEDVDFGAVVLDPEVRASVERFAVAWAAHAAPPPGDPQRATFSPAVALGVLDRTVADFVTPGDLYASPSLYRVGRLAL